MGHSVQKKVHLTALSIALFMLFISPLSDASDSSELSASDFKFYGIGIHDTIEVSTEKLKNNRYHCVQGNSISLNIGSLKKSINNESIAEKLSDLLAMDKVFEKHGIDLDIEDMPMNTLVCTPPENIPFSTSIFSFSKATHKILAISISIEKIEPAKKKLVAKFGNCINAGYCRDENTTLVLAANKKWHLYVYFNENLKPHYRKVKKALELKNEIIRKSVNEAF